MERAWLGVLAGMTALVFGCAPACSAATAVQPTSGAEPGVTIDEGSPAAKEYALALTQARRTGSPTSRGSHSKISEAPFGAGITPPSSGGASGSSSTGDTKVAPKRRAGHGAPQGTAKTGESSPAARSLPAAMLRTDRTSPGGDGSLLALLGGGVAILVLGGLGGVILRHNRRPPSHA